MARKRRSGCGILLLLWIIVFLVILIILLQKDKSSKDNKGIFNKVRNFVNENIHKNKNYNILSSNNKKAKNKKINNYVLSKKITLELYFVKYIEKEDKLKLVKVYRKVRKTDMPLTKAIELLIAGPTPEEERRNISSVMPAGLRLLGITIKNHIAYINFNEAFETGVGISMLQARLYQVVYTATQFKNIYGVRILINGKAKKFFSAEGLSIGKPLYRLSKEPIF